MKKLALSVIMLVGIFSIGTANKGVFFSALGEINKNYVTVDGNVAADQATYENVSKLINK